MSDSEDVQTNLAAAALAIAMVALLTTVLQVLQQFYATADGFRRCQSSVMGPWSQFTRLHWRFSEFRFETMFTTPQITVQDVLAFSVVPVVGGDEGGPWGLFRENARQPGNEMVSWILLLRSLRQNICETLPQVLSDSQIAALGRVETSGRLPRQGLSRVQRGTQPPPFQREKSAVPSTTPVQVPAPTVIPYVTYSALHLSLRERSWDFMPPDVVRPLAVTTVRDIGILARRLGMKWMDFRPADGIMRAEGAGHILSSTMVRSVGIMLQYLDTGRDLAGPTLPDSLNFPVADENDVKEVYIPRVEADGMGFGILPGHHALGMPDLQIGNEAAAVSTMNRLGCSIRAQNELKGVADANDHWTTGFSDIIAMAAPVLRQRGSRLIQVPAPCYYHVGLTFEREGFVIFHHRLQQLIQRDEDRASEQRRWICEQYEELRDQFAEWERQELTTDLVHYRPLHFLDQVHDRWDATTRYFQQLQDSSAFSFRSLVTCHVEHAVFWWAKANAADFGERETFDLVGWIANGMHVYFDELPAMVAWMQQRGLSDEEAIIDAWLTLVFRAFCWHRLHFLVKGPTIPSNYWTSLMPIYLG